jgi:hypothetical protein
MILTYGLNGDVVLPVKQQRTTDRVPYPLGLENFNIRLEPSPQASISIE